ncbi:MAG TPA: acetate uptake transporter, partial [Acidobacteriaceae bacterium]|nr:acetate uptake transporter [Acidobacteriaceae bacterium]
MPDLVEAQPAAPVYSAPRYANPAPLGLAAFGLTTVVLSAINAGWLPPEAVPAVVPLAFAFGGLAQLVAGALEFKTGNTFGMVAFTSYGMFWWWFALLQWTIGAGWLHPPAPGAVGFVLLMWGVYTGLL